MFEHSPCQAKAIDGTGHFNVAENNIHDGLAM